MTDPTITLPLTDLVRLFNALDTLLDAVEDGAHNDDESYELSVAIDRAIVRRDEMANALEHMYWSTADSYALAVIPNAASLHPSIGGA